MKKVYVLLAILLSTGLTVASLAAEQGQGLIRGTVVDEQGIPLAGAKVNAQVINNLMQHTLIRYVETDVSGHFLIDRLEWGMYNLYAMKEASGYPNTRNHFYDNGKHTSATLTPRHPVAEVRIEVGPKAGTLVGFVSDAITGAPLNATLKLGRAADPHNWVSTSLPPHYRVLVPPSVDIQLEVYSPGYSTWHYGATADPTQYHPLQMASGTELRLDIQLQPDPNAAKSLPPGPAEQMPLANGASPANASDEQPRGSIRGTVVDERGLPVSQARVSIEATDHHQRSTSSSVETDDGGRFVIAHLEWGGFYVYAVKEDAGYPNMVFPIYSKGIQRRSTVTPERPEAEIEMHIGPKAGILTGLVTDAKTGEPVLATFLLKPIAQPEDWIGFYSSGRYRYLVPPSTDLSLEVSAPGYKTWSYPSSTDSSGTHGFRLEPGAQKTFDIQLQPLETREH
ncbi:MAG: carboxypeptidase regulatory-like domain-containing protein [Terriglobia bacterium]